MGDHFFHFGKSDESVTCISQRVMDDQRKFLAGI